MTLHKGIGYFGLFLCVGFDLLNAVEINVDLLLAFVVHLFGLENGYFVDKLIRDLRCKLADVRIFPHERDKPRSIGLSAVDSLQLIVNSKRCVRVCERI